MKIRVFETIDDPLLKSEWERLEKETNIFPQSTYHWCSTWWKYLSGNRKLYVVMVVDHNNKALAIAPLCMDKCLGITVLRSFPVNYGDFYEIMTDTSINADSIYTAIYNYINEWKRWSVAFLAPINNCSKLHSFFQNMKVSSKRSIENLVSDISFSSWDDYLAHLSRNRRRLTKKKMKALEKEHDIEIEIITDKQRYQEVFDRLYKIQESRWKLDNRPKRTSAYMKCVRETNSKLFELCKMLLCLIKANGVIISYRIGIIIEGEYYDWNTSYDMQWEKYSPGLCSIGYLIKSLIEHNYRTLNFMSGVYDYKKSYSPKYELRKNDIFLWGDGSLLSRVVLMYHLKWRDTIKVLYNKFQDVIK